MISLGLNIWTPTRTGGAAVGPITLFDTTAGDAFTALDWSGTDASLTVGASQINQNSATVLNIGGSVKRSGAVIMHAMDCWTVDATLTLRTWPASGRGLYVGTKNSLLGNHFATHVDGGAGVGNSWGHITINGGDLANDPSGVYPLAGAPVVTIRTQRNGAQLRSVINYAATGDHDFSQTMVFVSTSWELPRLFNRWTLNFGIGNLDVTSLKVTAEYKNARFAFMGDSLTQGGKATVYADGFTAKIRADYPGDVLSAGAPSAVSADWVSNIESMKMMTPKRVFIMLGTNDIGGAIALATYQANMSSIIASLESIGTNVVLVSIPPRNSATVATWNAWLAGLGKPYVDVYTPLASGIALNATYDSGDGIHLSTAGHAVVYDTIKAAIVANGW